MKQIPRGKIRRFGTTVCKGSRRRSSYFTRSPDSGSPASAAVAVTGVRWPRSPDSSQVIY